MPSQVDVNQKSARRLRGALAAVVLVLCALGIAILANDVVQKAEQQETASNDNLQWNLAQADVEYVALQFHVSKAMAGTGSLEDVRERFNVLYSRLSTYQNSDLLRVLHNKPKFNISLDRLTQFLESCLPHIDGPDPQLREKLPQLAAKLDELRFELRNLGLIGITEFAVVADTERENIFRTLTALGVLATAMIIVLIGLVVTLLHMERLTRTRAREAQLALRRTEAIVETAQDAVVVFDQNGIVLDFNAAAERIFGYSQAEALGKDLAKLIMPPTTHAAHRKRMARYLSEDFQYSIGKGRLRMEAIRKGGETFPMEVTVSRAMAKDGAIYVSYARDLSPEVAAERELLQARDEALAGEKAKAELLAVMSHEMRTPLNGMIGMIELLGDTKLDLRQREFLEVMRTSGTLLLHHVNNVLDITRLESGRMAIHLEKVDLSHVVQEVFQNQGALALAKNNHLQVNLPADGRKFVRTDPFQLRQILMNLVGNAIKFTEDGTVRVEIEHDDAAQHTLIRVVDTGIGIADADLERIFEDFVTLDSSYARAAEGTGLGLGITRRVVENLGGEIMATSQNGSNSTTRGSTFSVTLPMEVLPLDAMSDTDSPPAPKAAKADGSVGLSVLVVEDNPINRFVVREMLVKRGHSVHEAHDGEDGVRAASQQQFDVVLMDISMPRMDGVQATRHIRAGDGPNAKTPIIALTAHALEAEVKTFLDVGMQEVLVKPTNGKALEAALLQFAVAHPKPAVSPVSLEQTHSSEVKMLDEDILEDLQETLGAERTRSMMKAFLVSTMEGIGSLTSEHALSLASDDLRREVHKIAGSAAMFGAKGLNLALREIEEVCKAGDLAQAHAKLPALRKVWQDTEIALQRYS